MVVVFNGQPWLKASEAFSCSGRSLVSGKLINQPSCEEKGEVAGDPPPSDAPTFSTAQQHVLACQLSSYL